jgi:hypothetical protein
MARTSNWRASSMLGMATGARASSRTTRCSRLLVPGVVRDRQKMSAIFLLGELGAGHQPALNDGGRDRLHDTLRRTGRRRLLPGADNLKIKTFSRDWVLHFQV